MSALKIVGSLALTAIFVLIAIILYKRVKGGCGCQDTPLSLESFVNGSQPSMGPKKAM